MKSAKYNKYKFKKYHQTKNITRKIKPLKQPVSQIFGKHAMLLLANKSFFFKTPEIEISELNISQRLVSVEKPNEVQRNYLIQVRHNKTYYF